MTKNSCGQGHGLDGFYERLRRLGITRARDGRWFAGVAAGLARRLGVDPLVVRAAFILFGLFFGMGIALYLVAWLLLPDEKGKLPIEAALKYGDGGSIFLLVIAGISLFGGGPWWNGNLNGFRIFGVIALVAGAWWFLTQTDAGRDLLKPRSVPEADDPTRSPEPTQPQDPSSAPPTPGISTGNAAAAAGATLTTAGPALEAAPTWTPGAAAYRGPLVRVRAIGFAGGLLVLGLATVAGAVVLGAADAAGWNGSHVGIAFAAALGTLGLGLVVAGLAGRRSGWLTPFALFGIVATLLTMVVPRGMSVPFHVGDASYAVTSLTSNTSIQNGIGNLRVDLTKADYKATPGPDRIDVTLGLGQLDLVVPNGVNVVVHAKAKAGDLTATGANETNHAAPGATQFTFDGTGWNETITYGTTSTPPEIEVFAEVGAGQINITTGSAS